MDLVKSVVIKGDLSASEDLTFDGQMEGSVTLPESHTHHRSRRQHQGVDLRKGRGDHGRSHRQRDGWREIEIRATGSITGDLAAPRLVVAEGGHLRGKVEMPLTGSPVSSLT